MNMRNRTAVDWPTVSRLDNVKAMTLLLAALTLAWGCGSRGDVFGPAGEGAGAAGATGGSGGDGGSGGELPPAKADKVDILLVIDNSRSMADKQEILSLAVPNLLDWMLNPLCLDASGLAVAGQPASPAEDCPAGSEREFPPLTDIHFGVMTTSLGGHGSDACTQGDASNNDHGRLMDRGPGGNVATYESKGFLAWDPQGKLDPPGQANAGTMETNLKALVLGAGQLGCGFEATLEAWYRFLIQPDPFESLQLENSNAVLVGTDSALLEQRQAFLRDDSLLMVMMVSDENDCSIRDGGQYYFAAQVFEPNTTQPYHLPKPRAACATDPNDPCCRSCGQAPGDGCSTAQDDCAGSLEQLDDDINLRCWDQKRRFGIDFLYPIDRYVDGLSEDVVPDREGNLVANPLYQGGRDPRLVIMGAMTGVPWQDIARRDGGGQPSLSAGLNAQGNAVGSFQSAAELKANGTWDVILGDPTAYHTDPGALPTDPLMIESVDPRSGVNPVTGEALAPPGSDTNANSINGHEYSIPQRNDLQYACVFKLISTRDCSSPAEFACDCDPGNDNPLCQNEAGVFGTTQYRAKAYPAVRQLRLLKGTKTPSFLGSICPAQLSNPSTGDFGYGPTVRSLLETAAPILTP